MRYDFEHVIVTLPIGVMKANKVQFQPPLLPFKQDAIKNIGMGVTEKIVSFKNMKYRFFLLLHFDQHKILRFNNRFWPPGFVGCLPTTEHGNEFFAFVPLDHLVHEPMLLIFVYPHCEVLSYER